MKNALAQRDIGEIASPPMDGPTHVDFHVHQQYRYEYLAPIHDLQQRLVMIPPAVHGAQRLLKADLRVDGADDAQTQTRTDRFGNVVYHITSPTVREAVAFTAEFTVQRRVSAEPFRVAGPDTVLYGTPTALTAPCARISGAARAISAELAATPVADLQPEAQFAGPGELDDEGVRQWAAARRGCRWAAHALTYRFGITGVQTPASLALHLGRGVCQDFAHLAIAILRELHVPVRYVSGHLLGEGAPHAWIEALLPDPETPGQFRVVPYDPTHRTVPGLDYVVVAVGRDYGDIAPTSGTFHGVTGRFTASKHAWIEEHT